MLKELLLKELSKRVIDILLKSVKNTSIKFYTKEKDIADAVSQHLTFVNQWSEEVNFSDLKHAKSTKKVFVQLELYYQPLRVRISDDENIERLNLKNIFDATSKHIVLLGQVGSGKTTSLKFFCQSILFNEGYFESHPCYPIVIKLNDYNSLSRKNEYNKNIIFNSLIKILGLNFDFKNLDEKTVENFKEAVLIEFLNQNNILLFLDGFDELTYSVRRQVVLDEFEKLSLSVHNSRIILTSRTSDYRYSFGNVNVYEICPLNDTQILEFAKKWLDDEGEANAFVAKIKESPFYDTAIRPLTIAHLCALFERNRDIPEKPKTVYKKVVMLLLEEWNQQRNVRRISQYAKFENDRKFEFLSSLAYNLTILDKTSSFGKGDLEEVYRRIYQDFDLNPNEILTVVNELESHNGLILETGFQKYEFAHKSIQEYLTAEYIVKLPSIPSNRKHILKLANEFAIAISISSRPSEYFIEFINNRIASLNLNTSFIKPFISRLLLEKVDFNKQSNVTVSALSLYSMYISSAKSENRQLKLFYIDDLFIEFENFIKEIFKRNDRESFFRNYIVKEKLPSADNEDIYVLVLKNGVNKNFPPSIYCRKSFYDLS